MSVTITQFGGHIASTAGDCAVVVIDEGGQRDLLIIDTAHSSAVSATELRNFVQAQLFKLHRAPVTLVTTHFHTDHYNESNLLSLNIDNHYYSMQAGNNSNFAGGKAKNKVGLGPGAHEFRTKATGCIVRLYVPAGGKPHDQNDQSMAVYIEGDGCSFLSFGDMTKDAYDRLKAQVGPLPNASVTKYPHHGNFSANYLNYYSDKRKGTAVLISGSTREAMPSTIRTLLDYEVSAVYCLSRTYEAKEELKGCWKDPGKPVYLCKDVVINKEGVSMGPEGGEQLQRVQKPVTIRRTIEVVEWTQVNRLWTPGSEPMDESTAPVAGEKRGRDETPVSGRGKRLRANRY